MKRFIRPIPVFDAPDQIYDCDPDSGSYRFKAHGINGHGWVLAEDDEPMSRVEYTYLSDAVIEAKLDALARSYQEVLAAFQRQWNATLSEAARLTEDADDLDVGMRAISVVKGGDMDPIQESIAPGGALRMSTAKAPKDNPGFINWLGNQQGPVLWIQEIRPGEFGVNQFVMDADQIRRVVLASRSDTVVVRTRNDGEHFVTHTYDRNTWLANTVERTQKVDLDIFEKLDLPRPVEG